MSFATRFFAQVRDAQSLKKSASAASVLAILSLSACDSYWWTRGQPPAPSELVKRAAESFDAELAKNQQSRAELASKAKDLKLLLVTIADQSGKAGTSRVLVSSLRDASQKFLGIEDSLSIESRPAFAELSGQLRRLTADVEKSSSVDAAVVETFVSRSLFLLSNELTVPAPTYL